MQRPLGITVTAILMVANVVCDATLSLTAPYFRESSASLNGPSPTMIFIHAVLVAYILFQMVCVLFYWFGKAWARWAVLVGCVYYLVGLRTVLKDWQHSHQVGLLTIGSGVLAVFLLWYLHTERVREWFAAPVGA